MRALYDAETAPPLYTVKSLSYYTILYSGVLYHTILHVCYPNNTLYCTILH